MAKLYFRFAAMNAGKSTSLQQVAYNYEERGQSVNLFTAAIDDRYGEGRIVSRLGVERQSEVFSAGTNFTELYKTRAVPSCILIDEAQFMTEAQVVQLHEARAHARHASDLLRTAQRLPRPAVSGFEGAADPGRRPGRDEDHLPLRTQGNHERTAG